MFKELFTFSLKICLLVALTWGSVLLIAAKGWLPDPPPKWVSFVSDAKSAIHEAQTVADKASAISTNLKAVADALVKPLHLVQDIVAKMPSAPNGSGLPKPPLPVKADGGGGGGLPPSPDPGTRLIQHVLGQ